MLYSTVSIYSLVSYWNCYRCDTLTCMTSSTDTIRCMSWKDLKHVMFIASNWNGIRSMLRAMWFTTWIHVDFNKLNSSTVLDTADYTHLVLTISIYVPCSVLTHDWCLQST